MLRDGMNNRTHAGPTLWRLHGASGGCAAAVRLSAAPLGGRHTASRTSALGARREPRMPSVLRWARAQVRPRAQRFATALSGGLLGLVLSFCFEQRVCAQTFPSADLYEAVACGSGAVNDPVGDVAPGTAADLVGTASRPAMQFFEDGAFLFIRFRLSNNPQLNPDCTAANHLNGAWGALFDLDGDDSTYEASVIVDGTGVNPGVKVYANELASPPDSSLDVPTLPALAAYPFCTHTDVLVTGGGVGLAPHFLTVAVPLEDLRRIAEDLAAGPAPPPDDPFTGRYALWGGSSNDGQVLDGDRSCFDDSTTAPTLRASVSQPVVVGTFVSVSSPVEAERLRSLTPVMSGLTESGNSVFVRSGLNSGRAAVAPDGSWTFPVPGGWFENNAAYTIIVEGRNGSDLNTARVDVTTDALEVAFAQPAEDALLATRELTLSGSSNALPGSFVTVQVSHGDGDLADCAALTAADGTWSCAVALSADGAATATVALSESPSGATASAARAFVVDTEAPGLSIDAPVDGSSVGRLNPLIVGSASDALSAVNQVEVTLSDDTGVAVLGPATVPVDLGRWELQSVALSNLQTYSVRAEAVDAAGNTRTVDDHRFTVDLSAPTVTIQQPADGEVIATLTPWLLGVSSALPGSPFRAEVRQGDGAEALACTGVLDDTQRFRCSVPEGLLTSEGRGRIRVTVEEPPNPDGLGVANFGIDLRPPLLVIVSPADNAVVSTAATQIEGRVEDSTQVRTVIVRVVDAAGSAVLDAVSVEPDGQQWRASVAGLSDGQSYRIETRAADAAGNETRVNSSFTVDFSADPGDGDDGNGGNGADPGDGGDNNAGSAPDVRDPGTAATEEGIAGGAGFGCQSTSWTPPAAQALLWLLIALARLRGRKGSRLGCRRRKAIASKGCGAQGE